MTVNQRKTVKSVESTSGSEGNKNVSSDDYFIGRDNVCKWRKAEVRT
jgi:hypothetical protein